jgi:hypothetical protein
MNYGYANLKSKKIDRKFYLNSFDLIDGGRCLIFDKFNNFSKIDAFVLYSIVREL